MNYSQEFPPEAALIVVDVQNDFADPNGSLFVRDGNLVAATVAQLIDDARAQQALIVCTQDWHPPTTPHFATRGGPWPVHCVAGTWGAGLHPALPVGLEVVRKGLGEDDGYSGFGVRNTKTGEILPTELAPLLVERGIRNVFVVGLALDVCVKATAVDAAGLGFETHLIRNATRAVNLKPGDDVGALAEMRRAGVEII